MKWNKQEECVYALKRTIESTFDNIDLIHTKLNDLTRITEIPEMLYSKLEEYSNKVHCLCEMSREEMYRLMESTDKYIIECEPLVPPHFEI